MQTNKLLAFLLLGILFTSCINSNDVKVGELEDFTITKFTGTQVKCKSSVEIVNESMWPITLKNKEMLIYAGEKKLGTVKFDDALKISANSKKVYDFQFTVEITDMELGFSSMVGNVLGNKSEYRLKGKISACSMLICKNIEINEVLGK